jgi:exonuclease III
VKIATFNINNINKRFAPLAAWLRKAKPDIVCLQELKCEDRHFPADDLWRLGYAQPLAARCRTAARLPSGQPICKQSFACGRR